MKKVINKKIYDTEVATLVAERIHGNYGNFRFWEEKLFVTKKENWFLRYEGGPLSRFSKTEGTTTSGDSGIIAYTPEQAQNFLEEVNEIEALNKYFPGSIEEA